MDSRIICPSEFSGVPKFPDDYYGPAKPHAETLLRFRQHILEILNQWHPYGVRGVGYQLETHHGYPKDDSTFDKVERQVRIMRLSGEIPFDWVIDESREIEKPVWWNSPRDLLQAAAQQFQSHLWLRQPCAVMVACEKHGLGGVLRQATQPWRVPLATMGGTYSHSFAGDILEWIASYDDRPVHIFYLGDFDPTGVQIPQWLHRDMYAIAPRKLEDYDREHYCAKVRIVRLAVNNLGQAQNFGGIPRKTKLEKNAHAEAIKWPRELDSVEVDSIPPERLQAMVREAIEGVLDRKAWDQGLAEEAKHRAAMKRNADRFGARRNGQEAK